MLKPTLPLVITPLVTAAVTGFGSILAASEGSIILAEVSFPIDVVAAVVGVYFGIKRRHMRMLDEIVLDLAPLEGRLRSLGAEARQLLRATPPATGRGTTRQPGAPARRGVLALANDSPILYIHFAYGSGRFQDASFTARGAFRQAVGGVRREESRRGRVATRSHGHGP